MNIFAFFKYVFRAASYGVMFAVVLLLIIPGLHDNAPLLNIFQSTIKHDEPLSYARAVNLAAPAVVNIYSSEIQATPRYGRIARKTTRLGSGVIMDNRGYILTNYHVVQDTDLIEVVLQSGQLFSAELIGFDVYTDLAVLKVDANNLPIIPQRVGQQSFAGDVVLAIGNPLNLGQTITQGIISATGRNGLSNTSYLEFLQMDAAINDGNSGGALVNTNGELVGINSRKFTNPQLNIQGIFFAVPYQLASTIMHKIIEDGRVVRGWLGISANTYLNSAKGFVIDEVTNDGPAQLAGLQVGDIVFQIGEMPITSITHALDIVAETMPNTTLDFKIYRKKVLMEIPVKIIEKKTNPIY